MTRYLKSVYAAVVADIGDFPRRQANKRLATKGDEGGGRKVAGSGAISARDLACNQRTPGHRRQADPARRAACGPSTGSGAAEAPFQHVGTATESDEVSVARARPAREPVSVRELWVSAGRCGGDMSTPQKCPPTRHYLQMTSDNRRYARLYRSAGTPSEPRGAARSVRPRTWPRCGVSAVQQAARYSPRRSGPRRRVLRGQGLLAPLPAAPAIRPGWQARSVSGG